MKKIMILLITTIALAFIFCFAEIINQNFMINIYRTVTLATISWTIAKWLTI